MRISCKIHGAQSGVMISPDLSIADKCEKPDNIAIADLLYELDGELAWEFHLSTDFAARNGLVQGTFPLPEQPGEWANELICCCVRCFEEYHKGHFDDSHRWVGKKRGQVQ